MLDSFLQEGRVQEFPNSSDTSGTATTQKNPMKAFWNISNLLSDLLPRLQTSNVSKNLQSTF